MGRMHALEESPWIDPVLIPIASLQTGYQHFDHIKSCRYPGNDFFLDLGVFFAYSTDISFELEGRATRTHSHGFALDQVKQAARYAILDDARGDPCALTVGLELCEPISPFGLKDPSFIHHALFEAEVHTSIGKEWIIEDSRTGYIYGLGAVGIGIQGSPWIRGNFTAAYNLSTLQILTASLDAEMGFGERSFHLPHFHGYGDIAYRLIDASIEYTYLTEDFEVSLKYLHSLYRKNCPNHLHQVALNISYPFNL